MSTTLSADRRERVIQIVIWGIVVAFVAVGIMDTFMPTITLGIPFWLIEVILMACFGFLHGGRRYGVKGILVFFIITWLVSNSLESLSIATGFPFGNYYYDRLPGPRIANVPLIIMPTYFSVGYLSFMVAHVLLDQYSERLKGSRVVTVPVIGAFVMVMWDLVMDPINSTVGGGWVWPDGGYYFGVPISNFVGWYLTVYLIFQLFALYLFFSKTDMRRSSMACDRGFWLQAPIVYGTYAFILAGYADAVSDYYKSIYVPLSLVCTFTMIFVAILALLKVLSKKDWPNPNVELTQDPTTSE